MAVGSENPAKSQTVPVISNPQSRPGVQLPGTRTRKIPAESAGTETAGEARQVEITHGKSSPGKQTWKGASEGYTTRSAPDYKPSPAADTYQDTKPNETGSKPTTTGAYRDGSKVKLNGDIKRGGGSPKQSVKGKNPGRTDGEAKPVAGRTSVTSY